MKDSYLRDPPFEESSTVQAIEALIEEVLRKARELLENVIEYTEVMDKKPESIVMELKKATYIK